MCKKQLLGNKFFTEHLCQGILRMQITPVYLSDQSPQCRANCAGMIYLHSWNLYDTLHLCACMCVHTCVEGPSHHPLPVFRGFPCTSVRRSWRQNSFRKANLLWKPLVSCFVWQGSQDTFKMCSNILFDFSRRVGRREGLTMNKWRLSSVVTWCMFCIFKVLHGLLGAAIYYQTCSSYKRVL